MKKKIFIVSPPKSATTTIGNYLESENYKDIELEKPGIGFSTMIKNDIILDNNIELPCLINEEMLDFYYKDSNVHDLSKLYEIPILKEKYELPLIEYTNYIIKKFNNVCEVPNNYKVFIKDKFKNMISIFKKYNLFSDLPLGHHYIDPLIKIILFSEYQCMFIFVNRNIDDWLNSIYKWEHPFISVWKYTNRKLLIYDWITNKDKLRKEKYDLWHNAKNRFEQLKAHNSNFLLFNINELQSLNEFLNLNNPKKLIVNKNIHNFDNEMWYIESNFYRINNRITNDQNEYELIKNKVNKFLYDNKIYSLDEYNSNSNLKSLNLDHIFKI
jgi:hypothetical protein